MYQCVAQRFPMLFGSRHYTTILLHYIQLYLNKVHCEFQQRPNINHSDCNNSEFTRENPYFNQLYYNFQIFFPNKIDMTQKVRVKLLMVLSSLFLMEMVIKAVKELRHITIYLRLKHFLQNGENLALQYLVILVIGWCQWQKKQSTSQENIALKISHKICNFSK